MGARCAQYWPGSIASSRPLPADEVLSPPGWLLRCSFPSLCGAKEHRSDWVGVATGLAARQRPLEIVRPRTGAGRYDAGGGAGAGAGLDQVAEGVDGEADVAVVLLGGGGGDDEDDLALDVAAEAAGQFGEG